MAATGGNAETADGGALSSYRWVIVTGMVLNSWAMTLPALSFGLLLPEIRDEFGLSLSQGGWLGSSVRVGNILVTLPAGFLLSRFRPLKVVIASLVAGTVLTLMHGLATGFAVFLIARIAFGVSFSVRNPTRAMLIQQWFPLREIALAQGIIIGLLGVAEFAAVYGTPLILEATGNWRFAYYVFAGFAAFTALLDHPGARAGGPHGGDPEKGAAARRHPASPHPVDRRSRRLLRYLQLACLGHVLAHLHARR